MTNRQRPAPWGLCILLLLAAIALPAAADELPDGVVAEVRGRKLTFEGFSIAATQQATREIKRSRSGPRAVLEQLIEELMVVQECKKLGIAVTQADVRKLWNEWDGKLRRTSGGTRTLRDEIQDRGTTEREFVEQMWHIIRKERIAAHPKYLGKTLPKDENARLRQVGIVIAEIRKAAKIQYGIETIDHVQQKQKPDDLGAGVVAAVNSEPITNKQLGRALIIRLPGQKVREYLDKECKTALLSIKGVRLSDAELEAEVEHLRKLWPLERELQRDEVWRTVSFKDRFETQFNMTMDDVRKSRYSRGLLGLVRNMRPEITEEEIRAEFERQQSGRYGAHILVYDIEIQFAQKKGLMANQGLPSYRDARKIANKLSSQLARGDSFDKVANDVNMRRRAWIQAKRIRIYNTDRDITLREQAERMRDGDISSPFDTLSEVHVMKRVGLRPARTLAEVRPHVVEMLARRKARTWIEEKLKDPAWVRLRWPLPERR
ncbi:MAG: hypothetical protein QNJ90_11330 [Planctomycetota bacterium]|nr:hypothetical protein [Planctomycetota bacterium]